MNFVYSVPVNGTPVNRTVRIAGNPICPVNGCPVNRNGVYRDSCRCLESRRRVDIYSALYLLYVYSKFVYTRSQSYKRNLDFKKFKLVLNLLTLRYLNLDLTTMLLQLTYHQEI